MKKYLLIPLVFTAFFILADSDSESPDQDVKLAKIEGKLEVYEDFIPFAALEFVEAKTQEDKQRYGSHMCARILMVSQERRQYQRLKETHQESKLEPVWRHLQILKVYEYAPDGNLTKLTREALAELVNTSESSENSD